jgi:mRNA interferase HigB
MGRYPDAADEIRAWASLVQAARWQNFLQVREICRDADYVNGYVVFNIRRNRYRLVTVIHFAKPAAEGKTTGGHVYIRSFLTHKQYDDPRNWDRRFGAK